MYLAAIENFGHSALHVVGYLNARVRRLYILCTEYCYQIEIRHKSADKIF